MIDVSGLTKTYAGTQGPVFADLSLVVRPHEVLWVQGPSGCGKSTLLNILGLIARPDTGSCRLGGEETVGADLDDLVRLRRSVVSTVFQRGNLFGHLTALDNVLLGMTNPDRSTGEHHLAAVGLADHAGRPAGLLSGGEQQRVAFARAASRATPILLADEPSAALDDDNAETVLRLLAEAARNGRTVVVASHDPRLAAIATSRVSLAAGLMS